MHGQAANRLVPHAMADLECVKVLLFCHELLSVHELDGTPAKLKRMIGSSVFAP